MKRVSLNFIVDVVAFAGFVMLTTTGVLMRYILPPGSGHYSTIWGMDRHEWGGIHFWVSVLFFSILAFHLILHWRWIVSVVTGRPREGSGLRAGLGIVGLVNRARAGQCSIAGARGKGYRRQGGIVSFRPPLRGTLDTRFDDLERGRGNDRGSCGLPHQILEVAGHDIG